MTHMDAHRAIWIEYHDASGYRGKFDRELDPGAQAFTAAQSAAARVDADRYAAQHGGTLLVHDDGEFLAFGVFVGIDPPDDWQPDFPPGPGWQFREGDAADFRPEWDPRVAADLLGAYVLVGVTTEHPGGAPPAKRQFHGIVTSCDPTAGISVRCAGFAEGSVEVLPPATNPWQAADPHATYHLRTTGESVRGVRFTATWRVRPPGGEPSTGLTPPSP